ncbi:hypothetical protein PMIN06_010816 [Paraphaeosphaeria minitans]
MAETPDELRSLVYSVVFVLFLRAARAFSLILLLANFGVLLGVTIQIQPEPFRGTLAKIRRPKNHEDGRGNEGGDASPTGARRNPPSQTSPRAAPTQTRKSTPPPAPALQRCPSPPPYRLDQPKSAAEPRSESILQLYEDIIASDAQTIQVQQDTMVAQQETIRAQAQMIKNMRLLLETQDERIEELERAGEERATCQENSHLGRGR